MSWTIRGSGPAVTIEFGASEPTESTTDRIQFAAWMGLPLLDDGDLATLVRESAMTVTVNDGETDHKVELRSSTSVVERE